MSVKLKIDGLEVVASESATIIEAAAQANIDIPHLCYFEGLPPSAACRLCLVEVDGVKGLVVSCARKVQEGMVVRTNTEKVLKARRFVLELIWSIHPGDCTVCDKSGSCELQKYTYELGIDKRRYPLVREEYPIDTTNPLIEKNPNLCVLCGRCIRICKSQGNYVLEFVDRGIITKVSTPFNKPLQDAGCTFCGSCISVCPVGCLVERQRRFRGREWEFNTIHSVCPYCGCGCKLFLDVIRNKIVRARPQRRNDYLCAKGKFGWDYVLSKERLTTPLMKKDGTLQECSWDEALKYVAEEFLRIKESKGADALGGLIAANYPNELLYIFGKFFRACIGTNNIDSSVRLLGYPTLLGFLNAFGASTSILSTLSEIETADTLLVLNSDIATTYPVVWVKIKKALKNGAKLITIDARKTLCANHSHIHLQPNPGSEVVVMDGMIKTILKKKLYNEKFVTKSCNGFNKFLKSFPEVNVERRTNLLREDVEKVAEIYADTKKKCILIFSTENTDSYTLSRITNLIALTGRVKGSVFPCIPISNLRGALEVGVLSEFYPGYRLVENAAVRKKLSAKWKSSLPSKPGLTAIELLQEASSTIFGMYIVGENPVRSFPDTTKVRKALSSLDFLVVQDTFLTETAQLADVVLPMTTFAESSGIFINAEGRYQRLDKALLPSTKTGWEVIVELSSRMGYPMKYQSEKEIADEIKYVTSHKFTTPKYRFNIPEADESSEKLDSEYPYLLMIGSTLFSFGDGTLTKRSSLSLLENSKEGYLGINPKAAESLGLTEGSKVEVSSRRDSIITTVKIQESLPSNLVFMPGHTFECNKLTSSVLNPITKVPKFRLTAVKITPRG